MIKDWLQERTEKSPHHIAIITADGEWTFAELNQQVEHYAHHLWANGINDGDFVAVLMPNTFEYVCLIYALMRIGSVLVPLNTRLTASELDWQLKHTNCNTLICSLATETQASTLANTSRRIFSVDQPTQAEIEWLFSASPPLPALPVEFDQSKLQAIVFTSGTTGNPKGVMLTFENHFWSAIASAFRIGVNPDDRWLSCLPLYHLGGLAIIFRSCLYGTSVILHEKFDVSAILEDLSAKQVTLISLVPTMLYRLLTGGMERTPSLRLILLGGAAASTELVQRSHEKNLPIALTYGLSEAASQVATATSERVSSKAGSVGKALMFTEVKIVDTSGIQQPPGGYGEILVTGKTVMRGYVNDPDATNLTIRDGWLHTGDIGYIDDDGDLWVVQRRSDLIVSGGENVYPSEVEQVLNQHSAVETSCVVGIEHPEWGQQVGAMIQLKVGAKQVTIDALLAFSGEKLAGYKQPRVVQFVTELPQTASGKIERKVVQEMLNAHAMKGL